MPVAGGTECVTTATIMETAATGAEPLGAAIGVTSFGSQDIRVKQGLVPPPYTPINGTKGGALNKSYGSAGARGAVCPSSRFDDVRVGGGVQKS